MSYRIAVMLVALAVLSACGGNSSSSTPSAPSTPSGGGTAPVTTPATVTLAVSQTASGVNIVVPAPASSPAPNAQDLGVGSSSAFNTGDVIHRDTANVQVLLFGPGLNDKMQVIIRGPGDIHVDPSSITAIQSTDTPPVPGISFKVSVDSNAALGARSVVLQDADDDITTFTGGLEVVP